MVAERRDPDLVHLAKGCAEPEGLGLQPDIALPARNLDAVAEAPDGDFGLPDQIPRACDQGETAEADGIGLFLGLEAPRALTRLAASW